MVVPVLITSCQVSLQRKIGPVTAHTMTTVSASANETGCPVQCAVSFEKRVNAEVDFPGVMRSPRYFSMRYSTPARVSCVPRCTFTPMSSDSL